MAETHSYCRICGYDLAIEDHRSTCPLNAPKLVSGPPGPETDWGNVDRLILLMSLILTEQILRRRKRSMPLVRKMVLTRMRELIKKLRSPARA